MPLGDSITDGEQVPGGYRIGLWQRMAAAGYRVNFVGSQYNGPASLGDHDHEGHPGWRIDQTYNPSGAPSRLSTLIDHITAAAPSTEVFVATIIPLSNSGQDSAASAYNATIPGIVQSKVSVDKHVHLVDMHSALTTADLVDGVHPTAGGYDNGRGVVQRAAVGVRQHRHAGHRLVIVHIG